MIIYSHICYDLDILNSFPKTESKINNFKSLLKIIYTGINCGILWDFSRTLLEMYQVAHVNVINQW